MEKKKNERSVNNQTTQEMEMQVREVTFKPETFNEEKNTIEAIFSTGARVKRTPFWGEPYFEELSMEKKAVKLDRFNNGAPFLNNHNAWDLDDRLGVVEKASVDGKEGIATVKFSPRDAIKDIVADIKSGIIRNLSVGYNVHQFEELEEQDGLKVYRATDWEPIELSAVLAGADDGAKFRGKKSEKNVCTIVKRSVETSVTIDETDENKDEGNEPIENKEGQRTEKPNSTGENMDKQKEKEVRQEAKKAEKERQKEIKFAVRAAGLDEKFANELIDKDIEVDAARSEVIKKLSEIDKEKETETGSVEVTSEVNEREVRMEGMKQALLHRYNSKNEMNDEGKSFAYSSLIDMARTCLEENGIKVRGLSKMEIAKRAFHSISDFPELLANVANKTLRDAYDAAPQTFLPFTRETTAPDFKQISRTQLGDAPDLEEVVENAEVKRGTIGEGAEKYQLKTYSKIVAISRKAIINDDLRAFTRVPELMGRAARDLESDLIWSIITGNPLMSDGDNIFHANHGNIGTAGAPSITLLGEGRAAMRKQVGLNGRLLNIRPSWLIVPAALETVAEQLITTIQNNDQSKTNPFAPGGRTPLQIIVEPRLDADSVTKWYLSADKMAIDIVELARLEGEEGPVVESRDGFDVEGMEIKIRHDVAGKAIDWRGLFYNAG